MSDRAAVMAKKGAEPTQTDGQSVRRIDLRNQTSQSLCQHPEVKTTEKGERRTSMERELAREICIRTQTLRLWWKVDPVEKGTMPMGRKSSEFIPLHPLLQSRTVGNPTVCEHDHLGCCL
jgi:hypothetical protein